MHLVHESKKLTRTFYLISHPNVVISRDVPVPRWPLSELGRTRMRAGLRQPWVKDVVAIYSSTEQKAMDGAAILGEHLSLPFTPIHELGENDRSATGFLPGEEFERVADEFFANPQTSVRGWERAVDAQARMVKAVEQVAALELARAKPDGVAIVSHGAVGTLLYCHLTGQAISRRWDQPPNGGGNWFRFTLTPREVFGGWQPFDRL
ncbi:MAG TPA: histidine phosphatase family protein [Burkholderiaceae bacterium]|nr:histidine phosphatase family protein [Burkholderiaceae bacterium]HPW08412.1 histidine phosphatase family protein [Burkholderiaceae bacterium]